MCGCLWGESDAWEPTGQIIDAPETAQRTYAKESQACMQQRLPRGRQVRILPTAPIATDSAVHTQLAAISGVLGDPDGALVAITETL